MSPSPISRRHLLHAGVVALAAQALPAFSLGSSSDGERLVTAFLQPHCTWIRRVMGADQVLELHCGMSDPMRLAGCAGELAGVGGKVVASGQSLSFRRAGLAVRVIIHAEIA